MTNFLDHIGDMTGIDVEKKNVILLLLLESIEELLHLLNVKFYSIQAIRTGGTGEIKYPGRTKTDRGHSFCL